MDAQPGGNNIIIDSGFTQASWIIEQAHAGGTAIGGSFSARAAVVRRRRCALDPGALLAGIVPGRVVSTLNGRGGGWVDDVTGFAGVCGFTDVIELIGVLGFLDVTVHGFLVPGGICGGIMRMSVLAVTLVGFSISFIPSAIQFAVDEAAYSPAQAFSSFGLSLLLADIHVLPPSIASRGLAVVHQLIKQRAVMYECLTQLFGVGAFPGSVMARGVALPGGMCRAVVLNDLWMVSGDELGSLVEVLHRVATVLHHVGHQPVCLIQRAPGLVDEVTLHGFPALGVAIAGRGVKLANVKLVAPIGNVP